MRKVASFCLAAVLLFGCMAGCGTGSETESSVPASPESSNVTTTGGDAEATTTTGNTVEITTGVNVSETGDTMTAIRTTTTQSRKQTTTTQAQNKPQTQGGGTTAKKVTATTAKSAGGVDMDAVFAPILAKNPRVVHVSSYDPTMSEWSNIKAITYDGADLNGEKTKVFAYIGYPEGASASNKAPAVVLVHGGGGHAFAEWVKLWTDRGYVAIAMDTTGFFPSEAGKGKAGWESDNGNTMWHYGLYGEFAESGYTNAPNNDEMAHPEKPIEQQWMYHAVSSAILAHNVLKADSCVDADRIGITGISWGGTITSTVIGYDTDFAFAIPVYNTAYQKDSLGASGNRYTQKPLNQVYWSPEERLHKVDFPVYWLCWANETGCSCNCASLSYLDTRAAGAVLNIRPRWGHSHGQGWAPEDIYLFADSVVMGKAKFTSVTKEPTVVKNADGTYSVTMTIDPADNATEVTATAACITAPLSYSDKGSGKLTIDQAWRAEKAAVNGNTVTVTLKETVKNFYIIITTKTADGKYDVCSQLVQEMG